MARARSNSRLVSPQSRSGSGNRRGRHNCNGEQLLKAEVHARILQNVKLKEERDVLKKKIIDLRNELVKVKEKTWKKQ